MHALPKKARLGVSQPIKEIPKSHVSVSVYACAAYVHVCVCVCVSCAWARVVFEIVKLWQVLSVLPFFNFHIESRSSR